MRQILLNKIKRNNYLKTVKNVKLSEKNKKYAFKQLQKKI